MTRPGPTPWWREPLVWLVLLIPASAVVMGVVLVALSVSTYDGLVVDDYYKRGLEIERDLARDREAARLGLGAALEVHGGEVSVRLSAAEPGFVAPGTVELSLRHPTRAGLDRVLVLERRGSDAFAGRLPPLREGRWDVMLESPGWRIGATARAPLAGPILLEPGG